MKNDMDLRHILDLAVRSYNNNQYTFTDFLTIAQMSDFYDAVQKLPPCGYTVYGGYEGAERVIIRFGKESELLYEQPFPIVYVCIEPLISKFAEDLTHRDVLGAIMNMGMQREKLGDILIKNGKIWVICLENMARLILDELTRIRHTSVKCHVEELLPKDLSAHYEQMHVQVPQVRTDAVVAKLCKVSRGASADLFVEGKIAVNGRISSNHSYILKEGDIISVRGYGKYRFVCVEGNTKKGNLNILVERFV